VGHVVDAVERDHEVECRLDRQRFAARRHETRIAELQFGDFLLTAADRVRARVVTDELRVRECFGHREQRDPAAAADIGDRRAALELRNDPVECRQDLRHQRLPRPRA